MTFVLALFFAVLLTTILVPPFMRIGQRVGMVDVPDVRRVHSEVIPRTGGIAVIVGTLIPLFFLLKVSPLVLGVCLGGFILFIEGMIDDVSELGYKRKLVAQIGAATLTVVASGLNIQDLGQLWPGCTLQCGFFSYPLTILFLVATINIINLSDGLDGLAGGICLLIFSSTALLAIIQPDFQTIAVCVCAAGAVIGFLRYNTHPAIVFLGDTGSQFLGFMVGVAMLSLTQGKAQYTPYLALYLLGLPVLDTLLVIVERWIEHRPLCQPDKKHLHHKLMGLGLKHHQAVVTIYAIQLGLILTGWSLRHYSDAVILAVYLLIVVLFLSAFLVYRRNKQKLSPSLEVLRELPGLNGKRKTMMVFSREVISHVSWGVLILALIALYALSPFYLKPVSKEIAWYALGFMVVIVSARIFRPNLVDLTSKSAAYFLGVYYIVVFEFGADAATTGISGDGLTWGYGIIFFVMAACYCTYIISTFKKVPLVTMDYLLLGFVILTFFLPATYEREYHLNQISAKILLIFLCVELLSYKARGNQDLLMAGILPSLGLYILVSFWLQLI